ncbi:MAG: CRISPR-associated ring nuclease Csm6 [Verrucomicrobiota bacterium]
MKPAKFKTRPRSVEAAKVSPSERAEMGNRKSEIVLLAVTGMSPAVLTETVWALAQESPAVIPRRVIAVTTIAGRQAIEREVLTPAREGEPTIWQALRRSVLGPESEQDARLILEPPRLIMASNPRTGSTDWLEDIRTVEDNRAAADFLLAEVRQHTASNDQRLVASLAGGRKTMGALLHAAFNFLAREQDRLTHVLVSEPFDDPALKPRFYFPGQPEQALRTRDGQVVRAAAACPQLADVPFVPLRNRFRDLAEIPSSFTGMLRRFSETLRRDATEPASIELHRDPPRVVVDGTTIELESERQLTVIRFLLEANQRQWLERDQIEAVEILKAWHGFAPAAGLVRPALQSAVQKLYQERKAKPGDAWIAKATSDDIKRPLSFLRKALEKSGAAWVPLQRDLRLPPFRVASDS